MFQGADDLLAYLKDENVENVDVRFCDLPGIMQHFTVPAGSFGPEVFEEGLAFDGSSVTGFQTIHESDMSLLPDPTTAYLDPFRKAKTLVVNFFVGPEVGGWFFPTQQWWVLMLWVVPPFLALTLSIVLRLSARVKSTAAAQQAAGLVTLPMIGIAYSQSTGALFGAQAAGLYLGAIAWVVAGFGLARGMRAVSRSRLLGVADGVALGLVVVPRFLIGPSGRGDGLTVRYGAGSP